MNNNNIQSIKFQRIYELLIPFNKYKILVYSGETDFAVPTMATLNWV